MFDNMNAKDFLRMGIPFGQAARLAKDFISEFILGGDKSRLREKVSERTNPSAAVAHVKSC
jgi:hypothetical protein